MAPKAKQKPRVTTKQWLEAHKEEYEEMIKSLGYTHPTPEQRIEVVAYLRKQHK
jgi:hypothetical protein